MTDTSSFSAFHGQQRLVTGSLADTAIAAHAAGTHEVLVFDDATGKVVDLDLRGDAAEVTARYAAPPEPVRGRGRPKLGVTAREVTLLPRHWDWLAAQPGGASVALRKLVEQARRDNAGAAERRARQDAAYRFMSTLAGDLPGYEDAIRALYANDFAAFETLVAGWPADIRDHAVLMGWDR